MPIEINAGELLNEGLSPTSTDFTVHGKCSNCGECCSDLIPVTDSELAKIKRYVKKNDIHAIHNTSVLNLTQIDTVCPFRDNEHKRCTIYPVRPQICRSYLCSLPQERLIKQKLDRTKVARQTSLRAEIFRDYSVLNYYNALLQVSLGILDSERESKGVSGNCEKN